MDLEKISSFFFKLRLVQYTKRFRWFDGSKKYQDKSFIFLFEGETANMCNEMYNFFCIIDYSQLVND